jgi:hypothetical protein
MLAAANQGFIGAVMEPTGPLIRDIWQSDFDDFLECIRHPVHLPRVAHYRSTCCTCQCGDTKILCRSFENWTRIIGLNLAWVLADEIDTVAPCHCQAAHFPRSLAACVLATSGSLALHPHRRASDGCATPSPAKRPKAAY